MSDERYRIVEGSLYLSRLVGARELERCCVPAPAQCLIVNAITVSRHGQWAQTNELTSGSGPPRPAFVTPSAHRLPTSTVHYSTPLFSLPGKYLRDLEVSSVMQNRNQFISLPDEARFPRLSNSA